MSDKQKHDPWERLLVVAVGAPGLFALDAWVLSVVLGWVGLGMGMWSALALVCVLRASAPLQHAEPSKERPIVLLAASVGAKLAMLAISGLVLWGAGWPQVALVATP